MILSDALNRIKFKIGSMDDISSRAMNPLVSTSNILYELNAQMINYAILTRGIQDVYSTSITSDTQFIDAPQYAVRSQGYNYAILRTNGWDNPLDIKGQRDIAPIFKLAPVRGIGAYLMIYNEGNTQRIYLYPMAGVSYHTTTLNGNISANATTITVASTGVFRVTGGRITIGSEKILYQYKDATNFYGCIRGLEDTVATTHTTGDTVKENNLILNYTRLPVPLTITDSPTVNALATELPIVNDHIEGLCDVVAYSLLIKIDPSRATLYKVDGTALFNQYASDIKKGYGRNKNNINIRSPYANEGNINLNGML